MPDYVETAIRWVAAVTGTGTVAIAISGLWHQQSRPTGRVYGKGAGQLTSRLYIIIVTVIYVVVMVLLWKPIPIPLSPGMRLFFDLLGTLIFFPSLALYLLGMRTLGTMFGASSGFGVRLYAGHRLITNGPYSIIRHPMYVAAICAGIGGLLIYRTWAMLFFAVNMFGLIVRAKREERVLTEEFGPEWAGYKQQVPGWIPKLFSKKTRNS